MERFTIANVRDIERNYERLKKKKQVLAPALYNAAKVFYGLGLEGTLWEEKHAKKLTAITRDEQTYYQCMQWLKDLYLLAYESTGIHILCDKPADHEGYMNADYLHKLFSLSMPYVVEFEEVCEGEVCSVAARFHPSKGGVSCDLDFWNGREFRHYHSIHVFEDYVQVCLATSNDPFDEGLKLTYEKYEEFFARSPRLKLMSKMHATALNCISAYADAINSIPETVTKISKSYTSAKSLSVVTDKPSIPVTDKSYSYQEVVVDLNKFVQGRAREKKEWQGGHHASPTPHMRSGYFRRCKNGDYAFKDGHFIKVQRGQGTHVYVKSCPVNSGESKVTKIYKL